MTENETKQKAKHTPGPWSVHGLGVQSKTEIIAMARPLAGEPIYDDSRLGEAEANARLIAAAPGLAEALQDAIEVAFDGPSEPKGTDHEGYSEWKKRTEEKCKAILKKAQGAEVV